MGFLNELKVRRLNNLLIMPRPGRGIPSSYSSSLLLTTQLHTFINEFRQTKDKQAEAGNKLPASTCHFPGYL